MQPKKIILVTGATGAQGGSVARALLNNKKFDVRILTRNAGSLKAIALHQAGAEIMEGDFNDVESLKQAMKDVYGVFGVTNYWEHFDKECPHGKNLIDAVHQSGIKHFVYSSLRHYHQLSHGEISVPHYDIKASLQKYAKSLGLPATFVHMAFYYENFFGFFPIQKDDNNNFYFAFPQGNTKLAMASVEDLGGVVATIFDYPKEYMGRTVGVVGEDITCAEYAVILSKVLKRKVYYNYVSRDAFALSDFFLAAEWANMFEVQRQYITNRQIDLIESYGLNPSMKSFAEWAFNNREKFSSQVNAQLQSKAA